MSLNGGKGYVWNSVLSRWDGVVGTLNDEPSKTVQADAKEADINKVISRIISGGGARVNSAPAVFADVSQFSGLQDALIMVSEAQEGFMSLDADVRERFDNDPVKLVAFLEDASNREEAVKLGLVEAATPVPASPVSPAPEPGK